MRFRTLAALLVLAFAATAAHAATGLAIVCLVPGELGKQVPGSCGNNDNTAGTKQVYKTPADGDLVRVDPLATVGSQAVWSRVDYRWERWPLAAGKLFEGCDTDLADPTTFATQPNCSKWSFRAQSATVPGIGTATLTWTAATTDTEGKAMTPTGHNVYRGTSVATLGKIATLSGTTLTYVDGGLAPGTYNYAVTTLLGASESGLSGIGTKTIAAPLPPAPVVTFGVSHSVALTTLTWSATNSTGCTPTGGWSGAKPASGTLNVPGVAAATAFGITCAGPGGTTAGPTLTVAPPAAPTGLSVR